MARNYAKHLAYVLHQIDYKDHILRYDSELVLSTLECYPAEINFEKLVEEEVKINMIEGYDHDNFNHRKVKYYDIFCENGADYFKAFVKKYSNYQLFEIIKRRIQTNSFAQSSRTSFKYDIILRHEYVEKFYDFILESDDFIDESPAQIILEEGPMIGDESKYWLFDQEPLYLEELPVFSEIVLNYRKNQVEAFKNAIGNNLCFDLVDLISKIVLKDITNTIENESNFKNDSDSDSD